MILLGGYTRVARLLRSTSYARGVWMSDREGSFVPHSVVISNMSGLFKTSEVTIYKTKDALIEISRVDEAGEMRVDGQYFCDFVMQRRFGFYCGTTELRTQHGTINLILPGVVSQRRRSLATLAWRGRRFEIGITTDRRTVASTQKTSVEDIDLLSEENGSTRVEEAYRRCVGYVGAMFGYRDYRRCLFGRLPGINDVPIRGPDLDELANCAGVAVVDALCLWANVWAYV